MNTPCRLGTTARSSRRSSCLGCEYRCDELVHLLNCGCKSQGGMKGRRLRNWITFILRIHTSIHTFRLLYSALEAANERFGSCESGVHSSRFPHVKSVPAPIHDALLPLRRFLLNLLLGSTVTAVKTLRSGHGWSTILTDSTRIGKALLRASQPQF